MVQEGIALMVLDRRLGWTERVKVMRGVMLWEVWDQEVDEEQDTAKDTDAQNYVVNFTGVSGIHATAEPIRLTVVLHGDDLFVIPPPWHLDLFNTFLISFGKEFSIFVRSTLLLESWDGIGANTQ